MVDSSDENANAEEIARWMEEDFWESVVEGIQDTIKEDEHDE